MNKINKIQVILAVCVGVFAISSTSVFGIVPCVSMNNMQVACKKADHCLWTGNKLKGKCTQRYSATEPTP